MAIFDGTRYDPVANGGTGATAVATLKILSVTVDTFGSGYTSVPGVSITDPGGSGAGATATALTDVGGVTSITLVDGGSGYVTPGGIRKFVDPLPLPCDPAKGTDVLSGGCPAGVDATVAANKFLPVAVPDTTPTPAATARPPPTPARSPSSRSGCNSAPTCNRASCVPPCSWRPPPMRRPVPASTCRSTTTC